MFTISTCPYDVCVTEKFIFLLFIHNYLATVHSCLDGQQA